MCTYRSLLHRRWLDHCAGSLVTVNVVGVNASSWAIDRCSAWAFLPRVPCCCRLLTMATSIIIIYRKGDELMWVIFTVPFRYTDHTHPLRDGDCAGEFVAAFYRSFVPSPHSSTHSEQKPMTDRLTYPQKRRQLWTRCENYIIVRYTFRIIRYPTTNWLNEP